MTFVTANIRGQYYKFWRKSLDSIHNSLHPDYENLILDLKSCTNIRDISRVHGCMIKTGLDQDSFAMSKLLAFSIQDIKYAFSIFGDIRDPNLFMFNSILRGCSISDDPSQAFAVFSSLRSRGFTLDQFSFITVLKSCARESEIGIGRGLHGIAVRSGNGLFINVKNTLLHMYCACGRIEDAHSLFDEFPPRNDSISFNSLMNGYLGVNNPDTVINLFKEMISCGLRVSVSTLLGVVSACCDLGNFPGRASVHSHCIKTGLGSNLNLITSLIDMYAKIGRIDDARRLFDSVADKDVVLWNSMIDKYAKSGLFEESLALLRRMKCEEVKPNSSTFVGIISSCAAFEATRVGRCIEDLVEAEGLALDAILGTALVDMYSKLGFLEKAFEVFERMEHRDVMSWTAIISSFGAHGLAEEAISFFNEMEEEGFRPNEVTFLAVLSACSHGGLVVEGTRCLERMVEVYGFAPKIEHYGCVIDLLGRAGLLDDAYRLITSLAIKSDATAWRALLAACRVYGDVKLAEQVRRALCELGERHPSDSILLSRTYAFAGNFHGRPPLPEEEICLEERSHLDPPKEAGLSAIHME